MVSMVTVAHLVTSSFWGLKKMNIFLLPRNYLCLDLIVRYLI